MKVNLKFVSEVHKRYISMMQELCINKDLSLVLKGSVAKGEASEFSDIDILILGDVSERIVDEIISCYGIPVMTNYTENPKGILILVYEDGLAVDLEFRISITTKEFQESVFLVKNEKNFIIGKNVVRKKVKSKYLPAREQWYKDLRLGHRALIKYLSEKEEEAFNLLSEMKDQFSVLGINPLNFSGEFKNDITLILREVFNRYNINNCYKLVFERLLKKL